MKRMMAFGQRRTADKVSRGRGRARGRVRARARGEGKGKKRASGADPRAGQGPGSGVALAPLVWRRAQESGPIAGSGEGADKDSWVRVTIRTFAATRAV